MLGPITELVGLALPCLTNEGEEGLRTLPEAVQGVRQTTTLDEEFLIVFFLCIDAGEIRRGLRLQCFLDFEPVAFSGDVERRQDVLQRAVDVGIEFLGVEGYGVLVGRKVCGVFVLQGVEDIAVVLIADKDEGEEVDSGEAVVGKGYAIPPFGDIKAATDKGTKRLEQRYHTRFQLLNDLPVDVLR